jgi:hypothetical protein
MIISNGINHHSTVVVIELLINTIGIVEKCKSIFEKMMK